MCNFLVQEEYYPNKFHHVQYGLIGERFGNPNTIKIDKMALDINKEALLIDLSTQQNGTLVVALANDMIQSFEGDAQSAKLQDYGFPLVTKENETDFIVRIEGKQSDAVRELKAEDYNPGNFFGLDNPMFYRLLEIPFPRNTTQIEIVGTWVSGDPRDFGLEFCTSFPCKYPIEIGNETYTVSYRLTEPDAISGRMKLIDIAPNTDRNSLVVTFEITEKLAQHGELDLTISPSVLWPLDDRTNSSSNGDVINHYQVLLDGKPAQYSSTYMYKDIAENSLVNVEVQFDGNAGTRQIEILGAKVVPEFGSASIGAVAIGILVSIFIVSKELGIRK